MAVIIGLLMTYAMPLLLMSTNLQVMTIKFYFTVAYFTLASASSLVFLVLVNGTKSIDNILRFSIWISELAHVKGGIESFFLIMSLVFIGPLDLIASTLLTNLEIFSVTFIIAQIISVWGFFVIRSMIKS